MTVDTAPELDLDAGLWLTISAIAARKNKSRQAISKRVKALVAAGKVQTKSAAGGKVLVNLAQFDRAIDEVGDAAKEVGAETKAAAVEAEATADDKEAAPAYRDHQAREKQYSADLKFLELQERLGNLVPVADLADAANKAAETCVRTIDRLTTYSEAMAAAVGKDGAAGARAKFKDIARDLRQAIATAFGELAGTAAPLRIDTPAEETESDA